MEVKYEWILCTDQLPPEDEYVLIYLGFGNYDIAKVELGISEEEREKMKLGELDDPIEYGMCASGIIKTKRRDAYKAADQGFNNAVSYCFRTKSGINIFGQRVEAWCKLPKFYNTYHEGKNAKFVYEDDMEPRKNSWTKRKYELEDKKQ